MLDRCWIGAVSCCQYQQLPCCRPAEEEGPHQGVHQQVPATTTGVTQSTTNVQQRQCRRGQGLGRNGHVQHCWLHVLDLCEALHSYVLAALSRCLDGPSMVCAHQGSGAASHRDGSAAVFVNLQ
jgi:hypothetical protein